MHRSKRVGVGTRPAVNRDEISTPWKRSKNRLVQDEWRLQSGALSPTHTGRGKQRAHTAQGFERAQSPNLSNLSGHSGHHPVDKLQIEGSLRNLTQASLFSRSPSHAETRPPTLWAQDRYFMAPKSQHIMVYGGQLSSTWMSLTPPMMWPQKCGQTKPERKTRDKIDVLDPDYLRLLPQRSQAALDGRQTCVLTTSERDLRDSRQKMEEVSEVQSLETPRPAKSEQILEEALRLLQGDGPMERIQTRLTALDLNKTGKMGVSIFKNVMGTESELQPAHVHYLIQAAGIEKAKDGGEDLVRYQTFLDILRISRNRKMAALQRAKELTRRGLKRWQANGLVRIISSWRMYVKGRKKRRTAHDPWQYA